MADDFKKLLDKASGEFEKKNYKYAIDLYRQILQIDQDCAKARQALRATQLRILSETPSRSFLTVKIQYIVTLAQAFFNNTITHNPEKTINISENFLQIEPSNIKVRLLLANALVKKCYKESALTELEGILAFEPQNLEAARLLAGIYKEKNNVRKGIECIQLVLKSHPDDKEMASLQKDFLAMSAIQGAKWDEAKSTQDLLKNKEETRQLAQESFTALDSEQVELQVKHLKEQIDKDPSNPENVRVLKKIGDVYLKWNSFGNALKYFQQAAQLDKIDPSLKSRIGEVRLKQYDHKLAEIGKQMEQDPKNKELHEFSERMKKERLQFHSDELRRKVKEHPTDLKLHFAFAKTLLQVSQVLQKPPALEEAISELQLSIKDPSKRVESYLLLGQCFGRKNLNELAVEQYEKALQTNTLPEFTKELNYQLGLSYKKLNKNIEAKSALQKVVELDIAYKDAVKLLDEIK